MTAGQQPRGPESKGPMASSVRIAPKKRPSRVPRVLLGPFAQSRQAKPGVRLGKAALIGGQPEELLRKKNQTPSSEPMSRVPALAWGMSRSAMCHSTTRVFVGGAVLSSLCVSNVGGFSSKTSASIVSPSYIRSPVNRDIERNGESRCRILS
jgi:hypothetical protein